MEVYCSLFLPLCVQVFQVCIQCIVVYERVEQNLQKKKEWYDLMILFTSVCTVTRQKIVWLWSNNIEKLYTIPLTLFSLLWYLSRLRHCVAFRVIFKISPCVGFPFVSVFALSERRMALSLAHFANNSSWFDTLRIEASYTFSAPIFLVVIIVIVNVIIIIVIPFR